MSSHERETSPKVFRVLHVTRVNDRYDEVNEIQSNPDKPYRTCGFGRLHFSGFGVYQAIALIVRYLSPFLGNLKGRAGVYT
jgi:hypothetical protein